MQEILINKTDGLFDTRPVLDALYRLPDGLAKLTVRRLSNGRTELQNAYLWSAVYPSVLDGLVGVGYDFIALPGYSLKQQVHDICKAKFTGAEVVNMRTGDTIKFAASTAAMDKEQFSSYIDHIAFWAANDLGVAVPEPSKFLK